MIIYDYIGTPTKVKDIEINKPFYVCNGEWDGMVFEKDNKLYMDVWLSNTIEITEKNENVLLYIKYSNNDKEEKLCQ